jgi:hypothetical protein
MTDAPKHRPDPTPHRAASRPTRRGFLIGSGAAVLVGAGGGVAAGFAWHRPEQEKPPAPDPAFVAAVKAAVAAEMARGAAAAAVTPQTAALQLVAANHAEHERVLRALVPADLLADVPVPSSAPRSLEQVRGAEAVAAKNASAAAAKLTGRAAVLLASISACEAAHAELLS